MLRRGYDSGFLNNLQEALTNPQTKERTESPKEVQNQKELSKGFPTESETAKKLGACKYKSSRDRSRPVSTMFDGFYPCQYKLRCD